MTMIMQHQDMGMMNNNIHNSNYKIVNKPKKHTFTFWETLFEVDTKYEPIKPVGKGAYGVVCSSINTKTNEKVAIKKINDVFDSDLDALRTLREVKILRHVRHENIIELKDVTIPSSKSTFKDIYLVYELMDTDLGNIIRSKQSLSEDHCQYFMIQLLRGLQYLHSANILHRDLKPANLLVNANADLKIGDFGLSRTCSSQGDPMTEYVVTRWYRAPELLLHCDDYGPSIDVWSVGCIFAEILGRKVLFPGETPLDQLQKIINVVGTQHDSDLEFILSAQELRLIKSLPYAPGIKLESLFPDAEPLALDLLRKMLVFNPSKRITVSEAVKHPYFADLYDPELFQPAPFPCDLDMNGYNIGGDEIRKLMWNEMLLYHPEAA